ncbi:MAG: class I SAM-dependent methyltransferase [Sphingomonadaceae bacterium]
MVAKTVRHHLAALSPRARDRTRRLRAFDERWGTETAQTWEVSRLGLPGDARRHAVRYQTTPLDGLIERLAVLVPEPGKTSFIDFGSGKGRVILTAAQLPFRRVIGVELSAELCAVAQRNLAIMQRHGVLRAPVEIVHADVTNFALPPGDLVGYLYNPFGRDILAPVVERLEAAAHAGARVLVLYVDPQHAALFDRGHGWHAILEGSTLILDKRPGIPAGARA